MAFQPLFIRGWKQLSAYHAWRDAFLYNGLVLHSYAAPC